MDCLADRFVFDSGQWIDAATGGLVRIHFEEASALDAFDWDEQCGRLFNVRHPLLNPLVDYGPAPDGRRFEAYECGRFIRSGAADGERLLHHLTEFLVRAGISLAGARSRLAVRAIAAGRESPRRPIGITLQPRRALDAAREALETPASAPAVLNLVGAPLTGLRTSQLLLARSARLLGYAPVSASWLVSHPALATAFCHRHLCVLAGDEIAAGRDLAAVLVQIAAASARRHVVVRLTRTRVQRQAVLLDPLAPRALMGMVFASAADGPAEQELFDAARLADGRPGAFLAYLTADATPAGRGAAVVHETPQQYGPDIEPVPTAPPRTARTLSAVLRAATRAERLAWRGRHAAATRLLERAARVLSGRDCPEQAADCLVQAGWLALDRGRAEDAATLFTRARTLAPSGAVAVRAATGLGESWTDDLRLFEAEAVLRGAVSAADALGDTAAVRLALAALARCLLHHDRPGDAIAALAAVEWREDEQPGSVALLVEMSRCHAAVGRTSSALRLARRAQECAAASDDARLRLVAEAAVGEALGAAGDARGMRDHLQRVSAEARAAHRPMVAIRAELACYEHAAGVPRDGARRRLAMLSRRTLPRLLTKRVETVMRALDQPKPVSASVPLEPPVDIHREAASALEMLLQVSQQSQDDAAALTVLSGALRERLQAASVMVISRQDRRVLACDGRPWVAHSTVVAQALATGMPASTDAGLEPREAGDAIRYGGEIIGAIACRWTAGAAVDALAASAVLHAAALAVAAPMRAVLDRAVPAPPPAAWGDLLGESAAAVVLRESVVRAARAPFPVLIEGESGSGKELVARAIHRVGPRRDRKFCALNCAALTDDLVEAELFGHARGAFTGAAAERAGLFEEADGGTLFLDEVGELSARAQAKLLRVLQEGEVRRVGENFPRRVEVRIVAATNRQLEAEATAGRFRADLRFRLDVIRITVPPLRDRPTDIPALVAHFWNGASKSVGSHATLTADTVAALARYDWPGNVRELQNVIAWMAVHSPRRGRVGPSSLPAHVARSAMPAACTFEAAREEFERRFVRAALAGANGQRARAAEVLGVTRQGLAKMIRRLGI